MALQTEQHACTLCENFPTTTPWSRSGKVSHCPLCHGEILMTAGVTYRSWGEPEAVVLHEQRHPWRWLLIGAGIAVIVGLGIWWAIAQFGGGAAAQSSAPALAPVGPPSAAIQ